MAGDQGMLPVYLAVGDDELKREAVVKRLIARFEKMGDIDFNMERFRSEDADIDGVIDACNTLPFMSDLRLVIVSGVEHLNKEDTGKLVAYVANPTETTVLCLVATKLPKSSSLYKCVAKHGDKAIINCASKSRRELPTLVRKMAASKGIDIDRDAAEMLVAYVGESTVRLDSELDKLRSALGPGARVCTDDIERRVAKTSELKPWDLLDALSKRDVRGVEYALSNLSSQSPYSLFALSVTRIRDLMSTKALIARGEQREVASALGKAEWQVRNFGRWAAGFSSEELRDALRRAETCEMHMKSGADPRLEFERWLLETCTGR